MGKQAPTGLSRKQRELLEQRRVSRRRLRWANGIVSILFALAWAIVLLAV